MLARTMAHLAQPDPRGEVFPITYDWTLGFTQPATKKAVAYWRDLSRGRTMPRRSELSPRGMREFLDHVNLVDVNPEASGGFGYVVSLQGALCRNLLGDMAKRRLAEILPLHLEKRWSDGFEVPRSAAAPVRLLTRASTVGKNWLACEALLAPLGEGRESVTTIFWVLAFWQI